MEFGLKAVNGTSRVCRGLVAHVTHGEVGIVEFGLNCRHQHRQGLVVG